jgi:hypothetical protein
MGGRKSNFERPTSNVGRKKGRGPVIWSFSFQRPVFFMAGDRHRASLGRDMLAGELFPFDFPGVLRSGAGGRSD